MNCENFLRDCKAKISAGAAAMNADVELTNIDVGDLAQVVKETIEDAPEGNHAYDLDLAFREVFDEAMRTDIKQVHLNATASYLL
jgi:predicted RNA methylase